jgi:hypothetical protein
MSTTGERGDSRDMYAQSNEEEDDVEKRGRGGVSETSRHEGTDDSQKDHDDDSNNWDYGLEGYVDATGTSTMDGAEPLIESNSSGLLSSVKLNETDKFEPIMILSNVTQEAKPAPADEEAPAMEEAPAAKEEEENIKENIEEKIEEKTEEKTEEKAPEEDDTIIAEDNSIVGIFNRSPDFLDVCCGGDPLELEKYLDPKRLTSKPTESERTTNAEGEAKTDADVVA